MVHALMHENGPWTLFRKDSYSYPTIGATFDSFTRTPVKSKSQQSLRPSSNQQIWKW